MKPEDKKHPIRYANCWEDADLLLKSIDPKDGQHLLCIASAGDNALALLSKSSPQITAFDHNPAQLALTELKQMAFTVLDYHELLHLLGITESNKGERLRLYKAVHQKLSVTSQRFWDDHRLLVENGLVHAGKFERYFKAFRLFFLPLVHRKITVTRLLESKAPGEQENYYNHHWNNRRWKGLLGFFFSRYVMGRYGRDPQYLEHVTIPVADFIRSRAEVHLRSDAAPHNYFLHQIMTGSFGPRLPVYLRPENFEPIRKHCYSLSLTQSDAAEAVKKKTYSAYCLSNIFEYVSVREFEQLCRDWTVFIPRGAVLAYWNLMNPRSFRPANRRLSLR